MKIFLAGAYQGSVNRDMEQVNRLIKWRLMSYFYKNTIKAEWWKRHEGVFQEIMVDSGAHTFHAVAGKAGASNQTAKKTKAPDPIQYTHDYCKWLQDYKDKCTYIELDVAKVYGWPLQVHLREIFDAYNLDPLYVWHPTNNETLEEVCGKKDFIGIGSSYSKNAKILSKILAVCEKHQTRAHVFGYTGLENLKALVHHPAVYSVDSSSWSAGVRFGVCYVYERGVLSMYSKNTFPKRFGKMFNKTSNTNLLLWNASQWQRYADYLYKISPKTEWNSNPSVFP